MSSVTRTKSRDSSFNLDFVGIGAAKSGTTWLAQCLGEHPQVCISNPKELNYFCRKKYWTMGGSYYGKGEAWLRQGFVHWKPGQIRGEISPTYLVDPESPKLLARHFPNVKIIVSFRNPTDALFSLYFGLAKQ